MKRVREWLERGDLKEVDERYKLPGENEAKEIEETLASSSVVGNEREQARVKCPYLDTVDRHLLDFDSEKLCSQTLTNRNVYVCLVCGKFFEGRGKHTAAYTHSLQCNHYVFMNMESGRSYCLPDGYEILDRSLADVQRCLSPHFSLKEIASLDSNAMVSRDVHGATYLPGYVGLNNLNATDDVNAVLHMLSHVGPFRDYFLQEHLYRLTQSKLVKDFGLILRKLWSPHNFKSTVSPQELVQTITVESKRKFSIGTKCEALELFVWLLATLQKGLDPKKSKPLAHEPSVLYEPFQGIVEVTTQTKKLVTNFEEQKLLEKANDEIVAEAAKTTDGWVKKVNEVPFTFLSLEIPPCPLFRDAHGGLIIPQVPLFQLLKKFDGESWSDQVTNEAHMRKQYRIKKLPRYLVLHLVRFTKNNFYLEKNPTIVTFPVRNLEMRDYLYTAQDNQHHLELQEKISNCPSVRDIQDWENDKLRELIESLGSALHINELQALISGEYNSIHPSLDSAAMKENLLYISKRVIERIELFKSTKYDLVANICHESEAAANGIDVGDSNMGDVFQKTRRSATAAPTTDDVINRGAYKIHVPFKATNQWYDIQDLHVSETTPQLIGVSESYILVYEKKSAKRKE